MDTTVCFPASGIEEKEGQHLAEEPTFTRISPPLPFPNMPIGWRPDLEEPKDLWRVLAETACDWDYWIDPQGRFLHVSSACEQITGYRPRGFPVQSVSDA